MTLTEISIKRPSLIIVIFTVLIGAGLFCYNFLGYELLPKFRIPVLSITTIYPGAAAGEVEDKVTKEIEDAVASLENLSAMRSISQEGASLVVLELRQSADPDLALQEAQRKINAMLGELPEDVEPPVVAKFDFAELPILNYGVTAAIPQQQLYQLLKDRIKPRLTRIEGVAQVYLSGGLQREIRVNLDPGRMRSFGVGIDQVTQAVRFGNMDFPAGKIESAETQYNLRVSGKYRSINELENLTVGMTRLGAPVKLKDVADVVDGTKQIETINRTNGEYSVGLAIMKQSDANAVKVAEAVKKEIQNLTSEYRRERLQFTLAVDTTYFTKQAADAVKTDLAIAVIMVAAVMLLFLHSLRNAFIVMLAIPASIVSTFIGMYLLDFTLNLMTLLAMSLVVGILVDDSIVVLENIYRHLERGKNPRQAALDGRNEIGFTALSITLVDVVVFFPLAMVGGIIGNIMREFSLVVVISTLLSLFVSFTITPMLASRIGKLHDLNKPGVLNAFNRGFEKFFEAVKDGYAALLGWCLKGWRKAATLTVIAVLFFGSFGLIAGGFIGMEFMQAGDRGQFVVSIETEPTSTIAFTNEVALQIEQMLKKYPEVDKVFTNVGSSTNMMFATASPNMAEIHVQLVPFNRRKISTDEFAEKIKREAMQIPGAKIKSKPVGVMGTTEDTPIQIVLSGTDYALVEKAAQIVQKAAETTPGAINVELSTQTAKPELKIEFDRDRMASYGLSVAQVGMTLRNALAGDSKAKFRESNTEYDIRIVMDDFDRSKIADVEKLTFVTPMGTQVELKQFATISQAVGPVKLERKNRLSSITVYAGVLGRPMGTVGEDIKAAMKIYGAQAGFATANGLPEGVRVDYDGMLKNQDEAAESMGIALVAAFILVYLVMVALYDSFVYPFVVMFSIPVALVGAFLALALTLNSLNVFSMLGVVMLLGLVAKNAILLVDFANQRKKEGLPRREALIEAGRERLRPIVMTTVAMVVGMIPIAVAKGAGAEWKNGLAWALIGGLTSSMFLTLVLVPIVYDLVDKIKDFFTGRKEPEKIAEEQKTEKVETPTLEPVFN
ncbi:MAG: efflux RND transporter permease subunit [Bacteroidia bacterium]|nr:efflux RND transporter permease subunit [Bacteroidia bacterium]MDW8333204.1 efflux RND transporter permease subunit [Bacteroidia bacterium]